MKYSLIIGRFQPLHEGHKKLIQSVLDEGKNVCVALRDTGIDKDNPYTSWEREKMIKDVFPQVKVIVIPDIEEICYGRAVGYKIRELRLDVKIENISATNIRNELRQQKRL